jgi:hypothetical protein
MVDSPRRRERIVPESQDQSRRAGDDVVVFTGDLVGSSKLTPAELAKAMATLEASSNAVMEVFGNSRSGFAFGFTGFRGDGWQCLGPEPRYALRGALALRASLSALGRPFDTRISIGLGKGWQSEEADFRVSSGPAFELSGRGLDTMEHVRRFAIAWEEPPAAASLVIAIFALCDEISRNWTPGQARVVARLLLERQRPNQEALAQELGIRQQTVADHLSGGGDWALQEALKAIEGQT